MYVLGWHGGIRREWQDMQPNWSTHDGAAVLLSGSHVSAAIEEERLNRVKHSNFFPARAIKACLEVAQLDLAEVDVVAMNFSERGRQTFPADAGLPSVDLFIEDPASSASTVRAYLIDMFMREFNVNVSEKLAFCNHHIAHLWSAWGPCGFDESLLLSLDGSGDGLSGMVATGNNDGVKILRNYSVEQSLGNLYSDSVRFLGYRRFDEYKVMGLAPYGDPGRFEWLFKRFYELLPGGDYRLLDRAERWSLIYDAGIISTARRSSEEFTQIHKDFAASLQKTLEIIVFHIITYFAGETGLNKLCYAGGVAHNCTLNGRILYSQIFDEVFVQPAAHDAGGALGAALYARAERSGRNSVAMDHLFLGSSESSVSHTEELLASWGSLIEFEKLDDPAVVAAQHLANGAVLGWVQGRSEFGPRALGHRSILADPRPATNKARINEMVKKRESYRPFAPSVLQEHLGEVIDLPTTRADYSFMTFALNVDRSLRERLAAVTHIDGTSRVQSVCQAHNPEYWHLINEFYSLSGVPAVLNTSFNNDAEPIIETVHDAVTCYLTTNIDLLIIGSYLIRKRPVDRDFFEAICMLQVAIPTSRKLVQRRREEAGSTIFIFSLEATASRYFTTSAIDISPDLYGILILADGSTTISELFAQCHVELEAGRTDLLREIFDLWKSRVVVLRPSPKPTFIDNSDHRDHKTSA
jgi:carbamoyltransferase